ncbi:MAG: LptF/LptG family permease [Candidatus Omnitrophica bacterium]|nr:LptF/LptG family permease [Candidatus Omnitrophota bacterium]
MKILRDHLLKEFAAQFFFSLSTLLIIFLLGRGLVQLADLIFNKDVDVFLVIKLLFFSLPFILTFAIPMSVLIAALLTFGKLSIDNEITAMRAGGIGIVRIVTPLVVFIVVLCLTSFLLSDKIASVTHYTYRRLLTQMGMESPAAALEEGTFIKKFKNFIIFIYQIDKNKLKGIRVYQPQEGKPTRTIIARKGELISIPEKNIIKLKLIHGTSDEPDAKDPSKLYKLTFNTYNLPLNVSDAKDNGELGKKPKDMTIRELRQEIKRLGEEGVEGTYPLSAEIHNKIAISFSSLAFLLVGIPLGIATRRSDKSMSFGIGLALMTVYWTLLIGGKALAQKGLAPPFLSLQFSNFVIGACGIYLFGKLARH